MTGAAPVRTVAVLGTGHMGSAMSRALAAAGFDLVLFNRTLARCTPLADELGAEVAELGRRGGRGRGHGDQHGRRRARGR